MEPETESNSYLDRISALEKRVNALESALAVPTSDDSATGTVSYSGEVQIGERSYAYSWTRPTNHILEGSWEDYMKKLAATAHPIRGRILQHLLNKPTAVAELVESGIVSSTGTAYHHLTALDSAGWIEKSSHGVFSIKPARVIALLAILLALEEA